MRAPASCMLQPDFEGMPVCLPHVWDSPVLPTYCLHSFLVVARFRLGFGSDDASMIFTYKEMCLVAIFQVSKHSPVAVSPASVVRE